MTGRQNVKYAVPLADGHQVEAVWYPSGTLCLSTQVGCAMACPYCASGRNGLVRSLTEAELQHQLHLAHHRGLKVERLTLSGIGEPLQALSGVRPFIAQCPLPVSVTTTGQPLSGLEELLAAPHNGLMLSLHAGTAATHRRLVPHGPDFEALWHLLTTQWPLLSRRQRRRMGINYLVLAGENDSIAELQALVERLRPFPELTLHLLCWNAVAGQAWCSPAWPRLVEVRHWLRAQGIHARLANRWRRRQQGGCGTLLSRHCPED